MVGVEVSYRVTGRGVQRCGLRGPLPWRLGSGACSGTGCVYEERDRVLEGPIHRMTHRELQPVAADAEVGW